MTTATTALREPTRESLAPLLLRRFHRISTPVLIGSAAFAALHLWFREEHLLLLLAMKAFQVAVVVGGLWISNRRPTRTVIVASLLALSVTLNAVTAATGILIGNIHTNALLYVAAALASSSFLPWGPGVQTASVVAAAAAALAPLLSGQPVYHDLEYDLVALSVAFLMSISIAREVENDTLAELRAQAATQALAESRADFEGVFRSSNVLLALIDLTQDDFVFADVNDTLARLFSLTPAVMEGKKGLAVGFSIDEVREWRRIFDRCASEGSVHLPEYRIRFLKPPRWFHISLSAIRDRPGLASRFSFVGVDITDLKRATEAMHRLNRDLEAQVRDRTALLEAANEDLESFAYSVSHDLRTPLRSIEGFAAVLRDDHGDEFTADAAAHLERIRSASRHMAQLIDDMLMLSRASRSDMRREGVDVTGLAGDVVAEIRASRPDRHVAVRIDPGIVANADPQLLRIVLTNLIGNAWKYTGNRDKPRVHVGAEVENGEQVLFVGDNGCGFDMRFVGKLFQPFQRLHAADEFEGTGVGLATVARIVRRHGGKVWAEGFPGQGATFRFTVGDGTPT